MRLTTKGRYAVTAMLDLALHADQGPVSLAEIARRQDISLLSGTAFRPFAAAQTGGQCARTGWRLSAGAQGQ